MQNARFCGFFVVICGNTGCASVQLVDGSAGSGFATEATARKKLADRVASYAGKKSVVTASYVCAFNSLEDKYKYLNEANELVRGQ